MACCVCGSNEASHKATLIAAHITKSQTIVHGTSKVRETTWAYDYDRQFWVCDRCVKRNMRGKKIGGLLLIIASLVAGSLVADSIVDGTLSFVWGILLLILFAMGCLLAISDEEQVVHEQALQVANNDADKTHTYFTKKAWEELEKEIKDRNGDAASF